MVIGNGTKNVNKKKACCTKEVQHISQTS